MVKRGSSKRATKSHHGRGQTKRTHENGYHCFCAEQEQCRTDLGSMSPAERTTLLKAEWEALPAHQKQSYENQGHQHRKKSASGRKTHAGGVKRRTHRKHKAPKQTHAKRAKRTHHKSCARKGNHSHQHPHHNEMHENAENIHQ